jgi:diamine N-acetyltransferase
MLLKKLNPSDVSTLQPVAKQSFIDAFEAVSHPENFKLYIKNAFNTKTLKEELENSNNSYYLVEVENITIGYFKLREGTAAEFFEDEKAIELQRIYILKEFWNKGYGKKILEFIEDYALQNGFHWLFLLVWFENHGAIKFYEREGYEHFAMKDFQFGDEVHHDKVFRKKLKY